MSKKKVHPKLTAGADYLFDPLGLEVELCNVVMRLQGAEENFEIRRESEITKTVKALSAIRQDRMSLEEIQRMNKKIGEVEDLVRSSQSGIVRASNAPTFNAPTRERTH